MNSMTGFGGGSHSDGSIEVAIELRSVNQRFLELNIRMPHSYLRLEEGLRRKIKEHLHRGKVDVFVTVREIAPQAPEITVDLAALRACKEALERAREECFDGGSTSLAEVASLTKDWFTETPPRIDAEVCRPVFETALQEALTSLMTMRRREGETIQRDLTARAASLQEIIEKIAARRPVIMAAYEERLRKRIEKMLEQAGSSADEGRILQEIAVYADKSDFTEEVVRFRSHVLQLERLLSDGNDVGRSLDFLMQEMNRETNTIGSKADDLEVTEYVLQLKNELEKIREQIQNIE